MSRLLPARIERSDQNIDQERRLVARNVPSEQDQADSEHEHEERDNHSHPRVLTGIPEAEHWSRAHDQHRTADQKPREHKHLDERVNHNLARDHRACRVRSNRGFQQTLERIAVADALAYEQRRFVKPAHQRLRPGQIHPRGEEGPIRVDHLCESGHAVRRRECGSEFDTLRVHERAERWDILG